MFRDAKSASLTGSFFWRAMIVATLCSAPPLQAQETGSIRVNLGNGGERGTFMISCIRGGEVVFQTEGDWGSGPTCRIGGENALPLGVYDIRVEGDGVVTQVKRGVLVTAGNQTSLRFEMQPGEGLHVIEYSTGGLAREEVAVRLRALEEATAALETRLAELSASGN